MQLQMRLASWISSLVLTLLKPIYWYRSRVLPPKVPPIKNQLLQLTASELAKRIRNGQISSEIVVSVYIHRIKEVNPIINAVIDERFEEALKEARYCDKMLEAGEVTVAQLIATKPLFGVPFTVKESCSLKGMSFTGCTLVRRGVKADEDGSTVASMKRAGAIALCVTNTPELCSGFESTNRLYGTTVNPYDGRYCAGGSSGGEGALLAAGGSIIGVGSDIAGSLRVPALFNGVYGHKPTPGLISIRGHFPTSDDELFRKLLVLGPMARYAEDLELTLKVMSADCGVNLHLGEPVDIAKLNVFYLEDTGYSFGLNPTNSDIRGAITRAADHFRSRGAKVHRPMIDEIAECCEMCLAKFFNMEDMPELLVRPEGSNEKSNVNSALEFLKSLVGLSPYTKSTIFVSMLKDLNGLIIPSDVPKYTKKLEILEEKILKMLGNNGVLLLPTYMSAAPLHGQTMLLITVGIYCLLGNVLGVPSTQVPMGLNTEGLPVGFQVIAAPNQDRLCLAVAKEIEKTFGGWIPPTSS